MTKPHCADIVKKICPCCKKRPAKPSKQAGRWDLCDECQDPGPRGQDVRGYWPRGLAEESAR